jgi:Cu-processing system ATP-binding protein
LDEDLLHAFELEKMFDKQMRTLSGGTTQKVSAVLAFLFNPDVLILDEPTAGLDPLAAEVLKEVLRNKPEKNKWSDDDQNETSNRAFYETGG